jgi:hypothetical protein
MEIRVGDRFITQTWFDNTLRNDIIEVVDITEKKYIRYRYLTVATFPIFLLLHVSDFIEGLAFGNLIKEKIVSCSYSILGEEECIQ